MAVSGNKVKLWLGFFEILWWHNDIEPGADDFAKWQHLLEAISNWKIVMQCFELINIFPFVVIITLPN